MSTNNAPFLGISQRAVDMIAPGSAIGLGTGHAAMAFLHALADRVRAGLQVRGVPTSQASEELARSLRIPLTTLEETPALDFDFDGADEVDPHCNLIKGYGGALVREKIVAQAARKLVILVGPEKLVPTLGSHGKLPVEIVPFALSTSSRALATLGYTPQLRTDEAGTFVSDNGNYILDCKIGRIENPPELERAIRAIPGVVGTGLFLAMRPTVLIQHEHDVEVRSGEIETARLARE